jgi:hypothetical protein
MCFPEGRSQKTAASGLNGKEEEEEKTGHKDAVGTDRSMRPPFCFFHLNFCFLYILLSQTATILIKSKKKQIRQLEREKSLSFYCADQRPQEGALRYVT